MREIQSCDTTVVSTTGWVAHRERTLDTLVARPCRGHNAGHMIFCGYCDFHHILSALYPFDRQLSPDGIPESARAGVVLDGEAFTGWLPHILKILHRNQPHCLCTLPTDYEVTLTLTLTLILTPTKAYEDPRARGVPRLF